jgi:hypothetical protein
MKGSTFNIVLVSTAVILTLAPGSQAFPQWMKPRHDESKNAPRQYNAYDSPPPAYGGYYSYGGLGPQPTIVTTPTFKVSSATSEASGEETSSNVLPSGKLVSHLL